MKTFRRKLASLQFLLCFSFFWFWEARLLLCWHNIFPLLRMPSIVSWLYLFSIPVPAGWKWMYRQTENVYKLKSHYWLKASRVSKILPSVQSEMLLKDLTTNCLQRNILTFICLRASNNKINNIVINQIWFVTRLKPDVT